MGNSLREVKSRITSTQKTSQITRAMYMVSSSKVRKAEKTYRQYIDFMSQISNIVKTVTSKVDCNDFSHPMLNERPIKKTAYLVVTSDTGLAGAYNTNVFKALEKTINENHKSDKEFTTCAIGRKGFGFLTQKNYSLLNDEAIFVRDDVMFIDVVPLVEKLVNSYVTGEVDKICVIYNHYVNTISQETTIQTLLPISEVQGEASDIDYIFEGGIEQTLNRVLPMYIENVVYGIILDSKTAEHSSRMTSMKNATDNGKDVIAKLQLLYNRARQEAITSELTDIIGGASAIE